MNDSVTEVLSASRTLLSDLSSGGGGLGGMDGGGGSGGVEVPAPQISGSSSSLRTEAQSLLDTLGDQRAAAPPVVLGGLGAPPTMSAPRPGAATRGSDGGLRHRSYEPEPEAQPAPQVTSVSGYLANGKLTKRRKAPKPAAGRALHPPNVSMNVLGGSGDDAAAAFEEDAFWREQRLMDEAVLKAKTEAVQQLDKPQVQPFANSQRIMSKPARRGSIKPPD
jgi:hypothetical protein